MDQGVNVSVEPELDNCAQSILSRYIFTAWFTVYLLFLPLFLFILYIGFNKWKKRQSSASALSHSDIFTLNMVVLEITSIFGSAFALYGYFSLKDTPLKVGLIAVLTTMTSQTLFHSVTCMERYLAVIHPVIYLRLRREGGVTVRNISITVVWVFSVIYTVLMSSVDDPGLYGLGSFVLSSAALPVVTYCSIFVLCVLSRPKPGERGGRSTQMDQSKRSIVYTMVAILGALLLRVTVYAVNGCIKYWLWSKSDICTLMSATFCSGLPSSLVLPLLFLHRARSK